MWMTISPIYHDFDIKLKWNIILWNTENCFWAWIFCEFWFTDPSLFQVHEHLKDCNEKKEDTLFPTTTILHEKFMKLDGIPKWGRTTSYKILLALGFKYIHTCIQCLKSKQPFQNNANLKGLNFNFEENQTFKIIKSLILVIFNYLSNF